ncbi:hypothetical protein BX616_006680, partial [Lobosporangium transversale]
MEVQAVSTVIVTPSSSPSSNHTKSHSLHKGLSSLAVALENDPLPSWTFFPPSATYIPHPPSSPTAINSPPSPRRSSPPPFTSSINTFRNLSIHNNNNNLPSSTPSTHHRILDHCFHLSIETRLKQAEAQYLASTQEQAVEQRIKDQEQNHQSPAPSPHQGEWLRRQRTLVDEAVVLGRKGSNVEAI